MRSVIHLALIMVLALIVVGCAYSTQSALSEHDVKSIEVMTFGNTTYYNNLEGRLTQEIIKYINLSPRLKVVREGGDAILSGNIYKVSNTGLTYDGKYQPRTLSTVISANYSLYDNKEGYFVVKGKDIASNQDSSVAGQFDTAKNEVYANAQEKAIAELAQTIVRTLAREW